MSEKSYFEEWCAATKDIEIWKLRFRLVKAYLTDEEIERLEDRISDFKWWN